MQKSPEVLIADGLEIVDLALYIKANRILIFGDFHIGLEDSLIEQGTLVPRFQTKDALERAKAILDKIKGPLDLIVINGDLKHEFASISSQEWRGILALLDLFLSRAKKVIIVKGNHDVALGPIAKKRQVEVVKSLRLQDIIIAHGDAILPLDKAKTVIIGHEHPAVSIRDGGRVERFKCFLKGSYRPARSLRSATLIAMPSFQLSNPGTDIIFESRLSPFLKKDLDDFEVFVVEDKVYRFGTVKAIAALARS